MKLRPARSRLRRRLQDASLVFFASRRDPDHRRLAYRRSTMSTASLRYRLLDHSLERNLLPDPVLRAGSRWGTVARLRREARGGVEAQEDRLRELVERMSTGPIAEQVESANHQHYE